MAPTTQIATNTVEITMRVLARGSHPSWNVWPTVIEQSMPP